LKNVSFQAAKGMPSPKVGLNIAWGYEQMILHSTASIGKTDRCMGKFVRGGLLLLEPQMLKK
jgi:hypothetical protein